MLFHPTSLQDAMLIRMEQRRDNRGFFARTICRDEFAYHGLTSDFVQANHSHNVHKGTLRGVHFQRAPQAEIKLVRCVRGAVYDVIVDLRRRSSTYGKWQGFELSAENGDSLYIPAGFAHGFLTMCDNSDLIYQVSHAYAPQAEGGLRYNDPSIGIEWPIDVKVISPKDVMWPLLGQLPDIFD